MRRAEAVPGRAVLLAVAHAVLVAVVIGLAHSILRVRPAAGLASVRTTVTVLSTIAVGSAITAVPVATIAVTVTLVVTRAVTGHIGFTVRGFIPTPVRNAISAAAGAIALPVAETLVVKLAMLLPLLVGVAAAIAVTALPAPVAVLREAHAAHRQ